MHQDQPSRALPRLLCDAALGSIRKSCPATPVAAKRRIFVVFALHTAQSIWGVISTASQALIRDEIRTWTSKTYAESYEGPQAESKADHELCIQVTLLCPRIRQPRLSVSIVRVILKRGP